MKQTLILCGFLLTVINLLADTNVTNTYIENPDFEARFAGWDNNGFYFATNSSFGCKQGMIFMERWVASGSKIPNVEISQDLYLPAGTYKLTAGCQNIQQSGNVEACTGAILYANDETLTVTESKDYDLTFTVLQGVSHIGFKVTSTNANWAAIDNVRLTLLETNLEAEHAELQKLIDNAEAVLGEGDGATELSDAINEARSLIEAGSNENIGVLAKNLSDATLNYRILNATGTAPRVTSTNKFVAAGATVLLGRMTASPSSGVLEKGFCWSTSPEPTIFDNRTTRHFSANGDIYRMEKLEPGTMYYVRPYILTNKYKLAYGDIIKVPTLPRGTVTTDYDDKGSTEQNYRIASAVEEIKWLYNNLSYVRGINVSVHYNSGTPTAECSYGGWMSVGSNESYQQTGTILHETNHGVGVGTSDVWWDGNYREDGNRGKWLGPRATQMIRFLNKDNSAYMTGDDTHMWPVSSFEGPNYGINGSWEDSYNPENTLLYYGNVLITHALHQDGLVCSSSVGFASPAYTFAQEDDTKYYIKTTSDACGNETSLLSVNEDGTFGHKPLSAAKALADDSCAWNIIYDPTTAYYILRNVGTGKTKENVQLLPSRSNYKKGNLNTSSYWIIINKAALKANNKTTTSITSFDASDSNMQQHWLLLTEDELTAFDQFCTEKAMPGLDELLAEARESMEKESVPVSEEISIEDAKAPMTDLIATIETEKEGYSVDEIENAIASLRRTFIAYLGNVQPASPSQPIPASWLIENRGFDGNSDGWTGGPESIKNGVANFLETTFNTYQVISPSLPAGNYVLTLNAFQRPGTYQDVYNDWTEGKSTVKAQLYATGGGSTNYQLIQNIWDGACEEKKTGTCVKQGNLYAPNNTVAANSWFTEGCYENVLPIEMTKASILKIGIRSTKSDTSWWTCFDNFGLQYYGQYDATTGISLTTDTSLLGEGNWYDLSGRKLSANPSRKGVFIHNGKKIVIK